MEDENWFEEGESAAVDDKDWAYSNRADDNEDYAYPESPEYWEPYAQNDDIVFGFDESTGETVEFETYDPILFEQAVNDYEEATEAWSSLTVSKEELGDVASPDGVSTFDTHDHHHHNSEEAIGSPFEDATFGHEVDSHVHHGMAASMVGHIHGADGDHDHEHCEFCAAEVEEVNNMSMAMGGFAFFGVVLFVMWYMLRSCKQKPSKESTDPSNPQSRGQYRPASLSPY